MRSSESTTRPNRLVIAIILAMTIVFAQWTGLQHGVRHAGFQHFLASTAQVVDADDGNVPHSCIAFDAAALADSISLAPYLAPLITGVRMLALWSAFASWDVPFTLYFSSRAPPLP
jgi:hypothetical protein